MSHTEKKPQPSVDIGAGPWLEGTLTREMVLRVEEIVQSYEKEGGVTSGVIAARLFGDLVWPRPVPSGSDTHLGAALQRLRQAGRVKCIGMRWVPA